MSFKALGLALLWGLGGHPLPCLWSVVAVGLVGGTVPCFVTHGGHPASTHPWNPL